MIDKVYTEEDLRLARINLVHARARLERLQKQKLMFVDDAEYHERAIQWHTKSVAQYSEKVEVIENQLNERAANRG